VFKRKELIDIDPNDIHVSHRETLNRIGEAGIEYYFQLVIFHKYNVEVELQQRLALMWEYNHPFRRGYCDQEVKRAHHLKYSEQAQDNELKLLTMLSDSEEHLFIKADILRRQKRFNEAKQVFRQVTSPESQHVRGLLSVLCTRKITTIVDTSFDVDPNSTKCFKIDKDRYYLTQPDSLCGKEPRYLTVETSSLFSFKELVAISTFFMVIVYSVYLLIT